jgi:hypothetical protein
MTDRRRTTTPTEPEARLARLGAHLTAHHFEVELTADGLVVYRLATEACCSDSQCEQRHVLDMITCSPREADAGRLWFYGSDGEPIAEADHIIDAVVAIKGRLAGVS